MFVTLIIVPLLPTSSSSSPGQSRPTDGMVGLGYSSNGHILGCSQRLPFRLRRWAWIGYVQGAFFNCSSRFSVPKWKTSCSQPGLVFHEIFIVKKLLVGWASFFHFGTENRADQLKKPPCIFWIKIILAIFLAKTRPDEAIFSTLSNLTIDFDFELSKI